MRHIYLKYNASISIVSTKEAIQMEAWIWSKKVLHEKLLSNYF